MGRTGLEFNLSLRKLEQVHTVILVSYKRLKDDVVVMDKDYREEKYVPVANEIVQCRGQEKGEEKEAEYDEDTVRFVEEARARENTVPKIAEVEVKEQEVETEGWATEFRTRNSRTQRWWRKGEGEGIDSSLVGGKRQRRRPGRIRP